MQPPRDVGRQWKLVLLGAPGAGKGTQARLLGNALGACALSTGDVFRAAREHGGRKQTALARAQSYMAQGELVPDAVVLDLIRERKNCLHCRGGFMLDGFPRTVAQAEALEALLVAEHIELDAVVYLDVAPQSLVARLSGRRVCARCQEVYHVSTHRSRIEGVCDQCGAALMQRTDDRAEAIAVRIEAYTRATVPVLEYYRRRGLLVTVSGEGAPADILARTLDAMVEHEAWR